MTSMNHSKKFLSYLKMSSIWIISSIDLIYVSYKMIIDGLHQSLFWPYQHSWCQFCTAKNFDKNKTMVYFFYGACYLFTDTV